MDGEKINLPEVDVHTMFHVKHLLTVDAKESVEFPFKEIFVVAGGREPKAGWLKTVAKDRLLYCADRGVNCCLQVGCVPQVLYGDCDSTSQLVYDEAQKKGTEIYRFNPAKDDTDLQLLLKNLPAGDIITSGIWGGRFDHLYSNVYTLLGFKEKRKCQIILADEKEFMLLMSAGEKAELKLKKEPEAISLLPLTEITCVDFKGVRWELTKAELKQLYPYAISNEPVANDGSITCLCYQGAVGLYIRWQDDSKIINAD